METMGNQDRMRSGKGYGEPASLLRGLLNLGL